MAENRPGGQSDVSRKPITVAEKELGQPVARRFEMWTC